MLPAQQRSKYLQNTVQSATPGQLLIMLYDGALRFCRLSVEAIKQQRLEEAHHNLTRAQDIIREFVITLDPESEFHKDLERLYDYFLFRLVEANTKKSVEPVEEVVGHLLDLRATWSQAVKIAGGAPTVQYG